MTPTQTSLPILIFADGASSGNPGPGGWGSIIVYPEGQVLELGGREAPTTNNRMELTATIEALKALPKTGSRVEVYTDSTYVIRGITQWIWAWRKRGWISSEGKEVANTDLWQKLFQINSQHEVKWHYVRGHSGIPGNERVDQIAVAFAKGAWIQLYRGPLLQYDVAIHDIPEDTKLPDPKPITRSAPARPYSYLSLIGNIPMRHSTWKECEQRVRGQSNAKFKKAMSQEDEKQILRAWGFRAEDLRD